MFGKILVKALDTALQPRQQPNQQQQQYQYGPPAGSPYGPPTGEQRGFQPGGGSYGPPSVQQPYQQGPPNPYQPQTQHRTYGPPPVQNQYPQQPQTSHQPPSYSAPDRTLPSLQSWDKLVTPQKTASPALVLLSSAIYDYLNKNIAPYGVGVSPEKIGQLAALSGRTPAENLYTHFQNEGSHSGQGAGFIDSQFTLWYNSFSLEFTTALRPAQARAPAATSAANYLASFQAPQTSQTPLLTLNGLTSWYLHNILVQPHTEFIAMSKLLATVRLLNPVDGTPLPRSIDRSAFPAGEDAAASMRNEQCMSIMRERNQHQAALQNQAARNADAGAQRIRDTPLYDERIERRYWL